MTDDRKTKSGLRVPFFRSVNTKQKTMKTSVAFLLMLFVLNPESMAQVSYAPWVKLKVEASNLWQDEIPATDQVGVPAYPGMVVLSVYSPPEGAENAMAPYINLASEDPPEQVEAWYKERLLKMPGWKYHDTYEFFYQGEDVMKAMSMQSPYLNVMELSQEAIDMVYVDESVKTKLKTRIQIIYRPEEE